MKFLKALLTIFVLFISISCSNNLDKDIEGSWIYYSTIKNGVENIDSKYSCPIIETYKGGNVSVDTYGGYQCKGFFSSKQTYTIDKDLVTYTTDVGTKYGEYVKIKDTLLRKVYEFETKGKQFNVEKVYIKINLDSVK